jgi:short-subunit dehydrogenase
MSSPREALDTYSVLILTGGSSGIGKSFIQLSANLKADLVFCNLSRRDPGVIIEEKRLNHFACDVSRADEIERASSAVREFVTSKVPVGRILLINNSGFGAYGHFPEPNLGHQLEMLDVNIRGLVHLTGLLLPLLKERGGAIINVASTAAFQPTPFMAAYGASKAFVLHWSLALNEELRGSGVRALAVCPGPTATEFFRRAGLKQGSVADQLSMTCEEVVIASLRALGSGHSQVVTGWKNKLGAFFSSKLPKPMVTRIAAMVLARFRLSKVQR